MPQHKGKLVASWNAFTGKETTPQTLGTSSFSQSNQLKLNFGNDQTLMASVYNRIAVDVASMTFHHCKVDDNGRMLKKIKSGLEICLNRSANIDQTGRSFMIDMVMRMLDEGHVAVVPIDTVINKKTGTFNILSLRAGRIVQWHPKHVHVEVYNEKLGYNQEIIRPKSEVAIIVNPFYAIMNEPSSTMRRLIQKLAYLDEIDKQSSSGKLNLIVKLPYALKAEARKKQAKDRVEDLEKQLKDSKFGVAYTDSTENIIQLARPIENNLLDQIKYLTQVLYSQLGISETILSGNASEEVYTIYFNHTIEPIVDAIVDEMKRKFLSKGELDHNQTILYFNDPLKLTTALNLAKNADTLIRNECLTPNELRQKLGFAPSADPKADILHNPNMPNQLGDNEFAKELYPKELLDKIDSPARDLTKRIIRRIVNNTPGGLMKRPMSKIIEEQTEEKVKKIMDIEANAQNGEGQNE